MDIHHMFFILSSTFVHLVLLIIYAIVCRARIYRSVDICVEKNSIPFTMSPEAVISLQFSMLTVLILT